jgi:hypothetical protein
VSASTFTAASDGAGNTLLAYKVSHAALSIPREMPMHVTGFDGLLDGRLAQREHRGDRVHWHQPRRRVLARDRVDVNELNASGSSLVRPGIRTVQSAHIPYHYTHTRVGGLERPSE